MDIKAQLKKDARRLAFVLITPPLVVASFFLLLGMPDDSLDTAICLFLIYSVLALSTHAYAIKNDKTSFAFYTGCGVALGVLAGPAFYYLSSMLEYRFELQPTITATFLGACFGFSFSFFFWAYIVNKKQTMKELSSILLPIIFPLATGCALLISLLLTS